MKHFLALATAAAFALPAVAQASDLASLAYVNQIESAAVVQMDTASLMKPVVQLVTEIQTARGSGAGNLSGVFQEGEFNTASIQQSGLSNIALVRQIGSGNVAMIDQRGRGQQAAVFQQGRGNTAIISQR